MIHWDSFLNLVDAVDNLWKFMWFLRMNKTRYKSCHLNLQRKPKVAKIQYIWQVQGQSLSPRAWNPLHSPQRIQVLKAEESCTLCLAVLGVGKLPYIGSIHTAYRGEDSSILGTWTCWVITWIIQKRQCFDWSSTGKSKEVQRRSKCISRISNAQISHE